jgi:hypothetical protein
VRRPPPSLRADSRPDGAANLTKEIVDMDQINLIQAKGGQGTSVTACAVALRAAGEGRTVRLDGHDRDSLAAILGTPGDGPVIPGLILGDNNGETFDLVVHDGPAPHGVSLLVTRPCYLALRRALHDGATSNASGVVAVTEPGRALGGRERRVFLTGGAQAAIDAWLTIRGSQPGPLLCPVRKDGAVSIRRMTPDALYR